VEMGFTCITLDQRSGDQVNGVVNQTKQKALEMAKGTEYVHALPDLLAAVGFTKAEFNPDKLIIWGSSYSASLAFILANIHRGDIDGLVTFSPGLYFEMNGKTIIEYAATLDCPTFMTCSREEAPSRLGIFEAIPHAEKTFFVPELEGYHGSKALWSENAGNEAYWAALTEFLTPFVDK
jgi:pimeloyl-ACP methyl ester carboxylesterase